MAKPVPPKRLYLEIPLEAWKRMKAECDRRRETLGGYVSISMLVTSMAYNLPKEKTLIAKVSVGGRWVGLIVSPGGDNMVAAYTRKGKVVKIPLWVEQRRDGTIGPPLSFVVREKQCAKTGNVKTLQLTLQAYDGERDEAFYNVAEDNSSTTSG